MTMTPCCLAKLKESSNSRFIDHFPTLLTLIDMRIVFCVEKTKKVFRLVKIKIESPAWITFKL